jgi:hypothetical protein
VFTRAGRHELVVAEKARSASPWMKPSPAMRAEGTHLCNSAAANPGHTASSVTFCGWGGTNVYFQHTLQVLTLPRRCASLSPELPTNVCLPAHKRLIT